MVHGPVVGTNGGAVTSIELVASKPVVLNASNTRVEIAPASPRGETAGPAQPASWPLKLSGPAIVSLYFNREGQPPLGSNTTIILRDAAGNEVELAWLRR